MGVDYLFIDSHFLCHRSYHALGPMRNGKKRVEVPFGVLREAATLVARYEPRAVVWCFDSGHSLRKDIYPEYKSNRALVEDGKGALIRQMNRLRKKQLRAFGFRNIWIENGYEADDLIAVLAERLHFAETAVIVSGDGDLLQCLRENIRIYNPATKRETTQADFMSQWGLPPMNWGVVKAVAGCSSDCIPGVPGVGERTAVQWLKGTLPSHYGKAKRIAESTELIERNKKLVLLPMTGLKNRRYKIRKDHLSRGQWTQALEEYGLGQIFFPKVS